MRRFARSAAALACASAVALASGCGSSIEVETPGQASGPMVTIGVPSDEPGVSWYHDGAWSGFGIDVATHVAHTLGYSVKQVTFHALKPGERRKALEDGTVDMVLGTYATDATGEHAGQDTDADDGISYAGPYLMAGEGLLVRAGEQDSYREADALKGHVACMVEGSVSQRSLPAEVAGVRIEARSSYQQCVSSLLAGHADAVIAPGPIVAGLRMQAGDDYVAVADASAGTVAFGIGVRAGEATLVKELNTAIAAMEKDGSWTKAADAMRERTGYEPDAADNPPKVGAQER
ncbi:MAG: transporter substrate-binding domain-containing protein [Bifidobacterium sp.]|nr:transporter substrate-binding domain-containing protein [Bifidobacterium sp.]